jgi:hypothetical protein
LLFERLLRLVAGAPHLDFGQLAPRDVAQCADDPVLVLETRRAPLEMIGDGAR